MNNSEYNYVQGDVGYRIAKNPIYSVPIIDTSKDAYWAPAIGPTVEELIQTLDVVFKDTEFGETFKTLTQTILSKHMIGSNPTLDKTLTDRKNLIKAVRLLKEVRKAEQVEVAWDKKAEDFITEVEANE